MFYVGYVMLCMYVMYVRMQFISVRYAHVYVTDVRHDMYVLLCM